jgi:membrane glycosyltransferase
MITDRPALPAQAALDMPVQRFDGNSPATREVETRPEGLWVRRLLLLALTAVLSLAGSTEVRLVFSRDGLGVFDIALLVTFVPLYTWLAFGFVSSAIGFGQLMTGGHPGFVAIPAADRALRLRTAVLMPICNESVDATFPRVAAMAAAIEAAGGGHAIDFFILSDSDAAHGAVEQAAWADLARRAPIPVYYRRREDNVARKPGNIADWVRRFGAAYECMLVLDADSMMSGRTIVGMAAIMEERQSIGLLQTVPLIINAQTLFQRWMGFAARAYGPVASAGLLWWSGSEANFWGHNAIARTRAFAESCGLPELPGSPPFGGHVLSHDVVEAALLRRRGWAVHMALVDGSYEEFPPTIVDFAIRDRRWMQGNLQHVRLLGASGLSGTSRLHLLIGVIAYLASPVWLLLLLITVLQAAVTSDAPLPQVVPPGVLVLTVVLLFGPKLMGLVWLLGDAEQRHAFGGPGSIIKSVAADIILAILFAPVAMVTQTVALVGLVLGRPSSWHTQNRDAQFISARSVLPDLRWHLVVGVVFLATFWFNRVTAIWLSPVTVALLCAPWLISLTSSQRLGESAGARGLFTVPPARLSATTGKGALAD